MAWFTRKIAVTFIDDVTNETIGVTKMPPGDLPETFEIATTLHLGDVDWSVVDATPRTRAEYSKSGSLTVRLRRIEKIDPGKLLYSLPSICDYIPPLGNEPVSKDDCLLAEDDWRQLELVAGQFVAEADAEIDAIRRIHEHAKAQVGWREIHVRRRPEPPIPGTLTLGDVSRAFGGELAFRGVSYYGAKTRIEGGYAFTAADGLRCYGTAQDERVTVLGIVQTAMASPPDRSIKCLAELAREFKLDLIHWCRCARVAPGDARFRQLLG